MNIWLPPSSQCSLLLPHVMSCQAFVIATHRLHSNEANESPLKARWIGRGRALHDEFILLRLRNKNQNALLCDHTLQRMLYKASGSKRQSTYEHWIEIKMEKMSLECPGTGNCCHLACCVYPTKVALMGSFKCLCSGVINRLQTAWV